MVYFTSDYHFGHSNILDYCNRPYSNRDDMCTGMVKRTNSRCTENDTLYHIGDFCSVGPVNGVEGSRAVCEYYESLIAPKVVHVLGNHDKNNKTKDGVDYAVMRFGGMNVLLIHKPIDCCRLTCLPREIDMVLCGHVHKTFQAAVIDGLYHYNVGVDVNDFYPLSKPAIIKRYRRFKKTGRV